MVNAGLYSLYIEGRFDIMDNHVFIFGDKIYLQSNEGSTGVRLTGILAEIIMILCCDDLSRKLERVGIKNSILPRFVDEHMLPVLEKN